MTPIKLLSTSSILIASVLLSGCGSDNDNNALPVYDTLDAYFITGLNYSDIVSADLDADGDMTLFNVATIEKIKHPTLKFT